MADMTEADRPTEDDPYPPGHGQKGIDPKTGLPEGQAPPAGGEPHEEAARAGNEPEGEWPAGTRQDHEGKNVLTEK